MKELINHEDVAFFRANGYLKVAGVLAADELKKLQKDKKKMLHLQVQRLRVKKESLWLVPKKIMYFSLKIIK